MKETARRIFVDKKGHPSFAVVDVSRDADVIDMQRDTVRNQAALGGLKQLAQDEADRAEALTMLRAFMRIGVTSKHVASVVRVIESGRLVRKSLTELWSKLK